MVTLKLAAKANTKEIIPYAPVLFYQFGVKFNPILEQALFRQIYPCTSMPNRAKIECVMPEVSVIIPTFNRNPYLCEAVGSVLKQDFTDYEIIIVDDGSTDRTYETIQKSGWNIRYIYQANGGVARARNTGIDASEGNFIAFLDSDDLWEPEKLSLQWQFFQEHPDVYICYTREKWIRNNLCVTPPKVYQPGNRQIIPRLLNRCFIGASSVMIRKELFNFIDRFDESMPVCEDLELWLRIAVKYHIYFLDVPLTIKRMGNWPQLSTTRGMDIYRIYALEKLLKTNGLNSSQRELFLRAIRQKAYILSKGCFRHRRFGMAIKYRWKWLKSISIQR